MGTKKSVELISVILLIFFLTSCDAGLQDVNYKYIIKNESGVQITIKLFSENADVLNRINIPNDDFFKDEVISNERRGIFSFQEILRSDSISVIFNNSKKISFWCKSELGTNSGCNTTGNLLITTPNNTTNIAEYTFTEDDFNNAIPCNGPCD